MKSVVSRVYSACKEVNRALARAWMENHPDTNSVEIVDDLYWLAPYKGKRWADGGPERFVDWVLTHPNEAVRAISPAGVKVTEIPPELRKQILDEEPRNDEPRIQTMPVGMTGKKGGR
jgi:hypothetical protein